MDVALEYIVDKFEHANLVMAEKANVRSVEAKTQHQKRKGSQRACANCSGNHKAVECSKLKAINARKDQLIA